MRSGLAIALLLGAATAHADDLAVGAAVGAGGQGDAGYGALELRLDGEWRGIRIGLGGRAVWEGGAFRTREWSRPVDAIALLRQLEASVGPVALAAGALAPSTIGHVAEGYRATLDDRARTGARIAVDTRTEDRSSVDVDASVEIDDVLDPALVGGAIAWQVVPAWGLHAATAVDPATSRLAIELGAARRWERDDSRVDIGVSLVGERWRASAMGDPTGDPMGDPMGDPTGDPTGDSIRAMGAPRIGLGAVAFASAGLDRANARWTIGADVRAGTGTNGAAFGPLYRAERSPIAGATNTSAGGAGVTRAILDDARAGFGAGLAASVTADRGWLSLGARYRPGLGPLGTFGAGAPMGRRLQSAAWIAASPRATAGVAEVRAVWATHFYTALGFARMYLTDESAIAPAWSATVWFGAVSR
ncbi:MAG: hypothetical protein AB7T06_23300 [Kofleriaceae bacterium]